ncbi:SirB2 family protein [Aestuariirhabdus sp. Z084]|uniref:SirB2 family protein n=1 Tax=Aestuariirhabdus haliotis TaxID=2918751 RepID=UPI00201B4404|nr:SirB2 family protein [Aestuariirhabdus haliotis]MCL6414656.1 SirB2 family protein [Aestuariirhabdus haliotis]MCL6418362.1 SirB2 family protein [Aestuariirhabdus haliotis]
MYLIIKHSHMTLAALSISFFALRAFWSVRQSTLLDKKWVRVTPHIVDTLLLACAIYLMITIGQYPFTDAWLTAKLFALIAYILLGTMAIKRGKTPTIRFVFALAAIAVFTYIVGVAFNHSYWAWW